MTTQAPPQSAFSLWPKQMEAMSLIFEQGVCQLLCGGAAGGGKSELARALAYTLAMLWPGAHIPIFRLTYPELVESHLDRWLEKMAELGYDNAKCWQATLQQYRFPNNSIVEFRHIDQSLGARKYLSAEWAAIIVDEASLFKPGDLRLLYSRVRRPKEGRSADWPGWRPLALYASNPVGAGVAYLKSTFVDPSLTAEGPWDVTLAVGEESFTAKRAFLSSKLDDNPSIDRAEYLFALADLPEDDRKRMLDGDWNFFEGKTFPMLIPEVHLVDAKRVFGPRGVPPTSWPRLPGLDYGTTSPTAVEWVTRDEDGFFICYLEYYAPGPVGKHIEAVKALMQRDGALDATFEADPQMWRKSKGYDTTYSVADEWGWGGAQKVNGVTGIRLRQSKAERIPGRMALQRMFEPDPDLVFPDWHPMAGQHGAPQLFIAKQCPELWRELNGIRFDGESEETVKEDDHAYDALYRAAPVLQQRLYQNRSRGPRRQLVASGVR